MTSTTHLIPLRYDSPTVTLEVMAREAAVSQWSDKPVVEVLRYQLQVRSLSGETPPVEIRGDRASFLPLAEAVQDYVQDQLAGFVEGPSDRSSRSPSLTPNGLTQHTLHLGDLHTVTGEATVVLGALQLADLENVLDQLTTAVRPLPAPLVTIHKQRPWRQWGTAAAGIVAAVGITTVLWPNYQSRQGGGDTALESPTSEQLPSATRQLERESQPARPESAPESAVSPSEETASPSDSTQADDLPQGESRESVSERAPGNDTATVPKSPEVQERSTPQPATIAPAPPAEPEPSAAKPTPRTVAPAPVPEGADLDERSASPDTASDNQLADQVMEGEDPAAVASPETFSTAGDEALSQRAAPSAAPPPTPDALADLAEVIRDRWTPSDEIDQPLVYTLVFTADGTLSEVIPADALSEQYLDLAGIPEVGTEWLPTGTPTRVQLLLQPDGEVEFRDVEPD